MTKQQPADKAPFSFEGFKISSFSFSEPPTSAGLSGIEVLINVSGNFNPEHSLFALKFSVDLIGADNTEMPIIHVSSVANFHFSAQILPSDIPDYFYENALAIVFPYIRAFISTLTTQAQWKPLQLPLLKLTRYSNQLKENTSIGA